MRSKSETVIPGFSSGFCSFAFAMTSRKAASSPTAFLPAMPRPVATSPKASTPRLAAAGIASKKPTSSGFAVAALRSCVSRFAVAAITDGSVPSGNSSVVPSNNWA